MPSFTDYLDSDYLNAANRLQPKSAPNQVMVYVESDEDVAFWFNILREYQSSDVKFNINLPSNTHLEKGKVAALNRSNDIFELISEEQLGQFLLICVDSDYDYLLNQLYQNAEKQAIATKINDNPFILQTYTYSIENYKCYAESLDEVCTTSTANNKSLLDFPELLEQYSICIYNLLLWNLFFYGQGREDDFTLTNFTSYVKMPQMLGINKLASILAMIQDNVNQKVSELETKFPEFIEDVSALGVDLQEKELFPKNAYLFLQGHTLYDNFVLMILQRVYEALKAEKITDIRTRGLTGTQINDEINAYKSKITKISKTLSANTSFKDCVLFVKVKADIENYMNTLNIG